MIAAINFDFSGTTKIGKYVLNHSFMLPGLVATSVAVIVGLFPGGSCSEQQTARSRDGADATLFVDI